MFTPEERDRVRDRVVEMARADPRVTAGALTGSTSVGAGDEWSDVDVAFGVIDGGTPEAVLNDWTEGLFRELGALDHWDLRAGSWVYRVFLLPSGLEVDVAVVPERDFGARGPRFRALFGNPRQLEPPSPPDARHIAGLGWHHVLHARSCIERGKPWQAEYWISAVRDYTLTLACLRLGEESAYAKGAHRLPVEVRGPLAGALVRSLDEAELRRALAAATACFIREVESLDAELGGRLKPVLEEFGSLR
jgi:hypothetical protein